MTELEQARAELLQLRLNPVKFLKIFMPEEFSAPMSQLHKVMLEVFFSNLCTEKRKRLVLCPRGIGKSTLLHALATMYTVMGLKRVIVYYSHSLELAELHTEHIKSILMSSDLAQKLRGDVKAVSDAGLDNRYSKKSWVAFGQTLIMPRGMGQQIRGFNWNGNRPDLIIMDDPEDKDDLPNDNTRMKIRDRFLGDVCKSGNAYLRNTPEGLDIFYVDTLKHDDALPIHLSKMADWYCQFLSICDPVTFESYCPQLISTEEIIAEKELLTKAGHLDVFYREYLNIALPAEYAVFKPEYFHDYDPIDFINLWQQGSVSIVLADPANTTTANSCDTAIVGVSMHRASHQLFVRDIDAGKYTPSEIYDKMIAMADTIGSKYIAIETTGPKQWITIPFRNHLFAKGRLDLQLIELRTVKSKDERIQALGPWYRAGYFKHNRTVTGELETQLLSFRPGFSGRKDIMDALAHIIDVVDECQEFFLPPASGLPDDDCAWDVENDEEFYTRTMESCAC